MIMNQSYNVKHEQVLNKNYLTSSNNVPSTLDLEGYTIGMKSYLNKENQLIQKRQETQLVSRNRIAYVEALVDINAVVIESIWFPNTNSTHLNQPYNMNCSNKESQVSPVVPLRTFIQEVLKRSRTTYSTLQTALFYLFRARPMIIQELHQKKGENKKQNWQHKAYISCGRRMFLASLVVASKFVQDKTYRNSAWAKIAGLPVSEINTAERYFLNLLDYRLYIDQSIFDHWHLLLHEKTTSRMHHIPTSLRDLTCISFAPHSYPPSPTFSFNELLPSFNLNPDTTTLPLPPPPPPPPPPQPPIPSLSLPSSISSSPAQTPIQISPVRICQKRKYDSKEHTALLDKKHCRFWQ